MGSSPFGIASYDPFEKTKYDMYIYPIYDKEDNKKITGLRFELYHKERRFNYGDNYRPVVLFNIG